MASDEKSSGQKRFWKGGDKMKSSGGPIYGIGVIGAAIYFLQHATTFEAVVVGLAKAVFWPGVIVYQVMSMWKM